MNSHTCRLTGAPLANQSARQGTGAPGQWWNTYLERVQIEQPARVAPRKIRQVAPSRPRLQLLRPVETSFRRRVRIAQPLCCACNLIKNVYFLSVCNSASAQFGTLVAPAKAAAYCQYWTAITRATLPATLLLASCLGLLKLSDGETRALATILRQSY